MADQSNIQSAASKSIRPFRSSEEYLYAMKEDLAEWLNTLYDLELSADTFMEGLDSGCALCRHANNVNRAAHDFQLEFPEAARSMKLPAKDVVFQCRNVIPGSFLARDNVSNFISWCRQELWIKDVLMFETNDLVERCNEKNFVLCLLEVARRGAKFGMLAPMLIQLEEEIEEEIRDQESSSRMEATEEERPESMCESLVEEKSSKSPKKEQQVEEEPEPFVWPQKRVLCDMRNLDELVREILGRCSCPAQFPMIKVSEGKYKVGDSSALIFIRVLRTHVMVRVGGGWDTLEHYLDKHDPCRCAAFAHRFHQNKPGAQSQGAQSKSSSAHSSRSTSPGPHWRNEGMTPCKVPDRRSTEPAPCAGSSPGRAGRSQNCSGPTEPDGPIHSLLPRPPRDRSEPRHFTRLRNKETVLPLTRRLSGDSDSSTASSKGGGGPYSRRSGEEVVLLVNRKEGKHIIERPGAGNTPRSLRPSPRARSQSRDRAALAPILKLNPPSSEEPQPERGRSLGSNGPRRFHVPRSHSQGKLPSRTRSSDASPAPVSCFRDPIREDLKAKQGPLSSPRTTKRQPSTSTNSPLKGASSNLSSPSKKTITTPRPPAPRSPSLGKGRLLPPVSGGRQSPHSSPNHHHRHVARPLRNSPRSSIGRGQHRNWSGEEEQSSGFGFGMLPALDPQKEQDLYRSFEEEFIANTRQVTAMSGGGSRTQLVASTDHNVTDSAYSSSNSSSSSLNVGAKVGPLPDLRESRRTPRPFAPDDPLNILYGHNISGTSSLVHGESEHWVGRGLKKLPAISSSTEEKERTSSMSDLRDSDQLLNQVPFQSPCRNLNGGCASTRGLAGNGNDLEGDIPPQNHQPDLPFDENVSDDLPPPEACPSPISFPPSEEYQDSSSETSSMCFSLSETHSESPPPAPCPGLANGGTEISKKDTHKHKLRARVRPRTDNRPAHSPSRIPTPVSYRSPCHTPPMSPQGRAATCKSLHQAFADMIHPQQRSSAVGQKECPFPGQSGGLDTEAWM